MLGFPDEIRYPTFYGYPSAATRRILRTTGKRGEPKVSTSFVAGEHDLRSLAAMVNQERDDLPEKGVPLSLLSDLRDQIPCDYVLFQGYDTDETVLVRPTSARG